MSDEQKDGKVFVTHSAARDAAYAGLGIPDDANHLNLYQSMGNCADSTLPMSIAIGVLEVDTILSWPPNKQWILVQQIMAISRNSCIFPSGHVVRHAALKIVS